MKWNWKLDFMHDNEIEMSIRKISCYVSIGENFHTSNSAISEEKNPTVIKTAIFDLVFFIDFK